MRFTRFTVENISFENASLQVLHEWAVNAIYEWSRIFVFETIKYGAYPDMSDKNGVTLLMEAAKVGNPEIIDILLAEGADIDTQDNNGNTALMYASNLTIVKRLVEWGADFNIWNDDNDDPVSKAFYQNQKEIYDFYVANGAKRDILEGEYKAMANRCSKDTTTLLNKLCKYGFKFENAQNSASQYPTLLNVLVKENMYDPICKLLKNGINPNTKDSYGRTALHYAIIHNASSMIVYELVSAVADVNATVVKGNTPLHYVKVPEMRNSSITQNMVRIINFLMEHGADEQIKNLNGQKAGGAVILGGDGPTYSGDGLYTNALFLNELTYPKYKDKLNVKYNPGT